MWLSILAAAGVAVLEYFTLQTYRSFRQLPAAAKAYHFRVLWLSSALILIPPVSYTHLTLPTTPYV